MQLHANLGIQRFEFLQILLGVLPIRLGPRWVEVREFLAHAVHALHPEFHIEPDVGIVLRFGAGLGLAKQVVGNPPRDREASHAVARLLERVRHFAFEVQSAEEHEMGRLELLNVAGCGLIAVRIDSGPHDGLNAHAVATHALNEVRDDGRGTRHSHGQSVECGRATVRTTDESQGREQAECRDLKRSNEHGRLTR